jgi:2-oxoglutarate ferredoxin oxidoreductase subunit beta
MSDIADLDISGAGSRRPQPAGTDDGADPLTYAENTWCPGCGNFGILNVWKTLIDELADNGVPRERIVVVAGIGCHAKIADYLNLNTFYSLHGRTIPVATGIKLGNPELTVIAHAGDGDCYGEGLEHMLFAAKRNIDISLMVHDNGVYALTTGQYTPTSPRGFRGKSTPGGSAEQPINPLELALAGGATFVARSYSRGAERLRQTMLDAVLHRGFSLVDILQVCATFNNLYSYYNERTFDMDDNDPSSRTDALNRIGEWTYGGDGRIALGTFYRSDADTFDGAFRDIDRSTFDREATVRDLLARRV